jgi:hypothetical protein
MVGLGATSYDLIRSERTSVLRKSGSIERVLFDVMDETAYLIAVTRKRRAVWNEREHDSVKTAI